MKLRAILKCCELSGLLGSDGGLRNGESQRDSDSKPSNGIARNELLWGNQDHGYNPERVAAPSDGNNECRRNPVGVETSAGPRSQARRVCANPGLEVGIPLGFTQFSKTSRPLRGTIVILFFAASLGMAQRWRGGWGGGEHWRPEYESCRTERRIGPIKPVSKRTFSLSPECAAAASHTGRDHAGPGNGGPIFRTAI